MMGWDGLRSWDGEFFTQKGHHVGVFLARKTKMDFAADRKWSYKCRSSYSTEDLLDGKNVTNNSSPEGEARIDIQRNLNRLFNVTGWWSVSLSTV